MFDIQRRYRAVARDRGFRIPDGYDDLAPQLAAAEKALAIRPEQTVPCHNDLLPGNFIHDGERLRIVDWEYAGMGNRYFDLANLSVNNGLNEAGDEWLLECYWGEPCTRRRLATVRLMRIMSDFREAMWGVVQQALSDLDFDFAAYAEQHFERLDRTAADRAFRRALG